MRRTRFLSLLGVLATASAALVAGASTPATATTPAMSVTHYSGTLSDGATWIGDVPSNWHGVLVLYSHGFGSLNAADAPDPATQTALLQAGYGLVGSSYTGPSLWAVASAPHDQFAALSAITKKIGRPYQVFALGTSMGGLISALEDQHARGRIDGVLSTCGLLGGGVNLNNYQLDGEYAIAELLAPGQHVQLVDYTDKAQADRAIQQLTSAVSAAQATAAGRARIALAAALLNTPDWITGANPPRSPADTEAQEAQWLQQQLAFVIGARSSIEQAVGGNASWNVGVDYGSLVHRSAKYRQIRALYRSAGLNLRADENRLTAHADIHPDVPAVRKLTATAVPSGHLSVPELTLHTISDQLAPLAYENWYRAQVQSAGDATLLRQAYVKAIGHCNFTPSELIAGLRTVQKRVTSGRWPSTSAAALNRRAAASGLGSARFVDAVPPPFVNARVFRRCR
jgi:hypothetical protein